MIENDQLKKWVERGVISQSQADEMSSDIAAYKKEKSSSNIIVAISTIGAILLGLGAILLVATNWETMPDPMKVLLLLISTFAAFYAGFVFRYEKENFPKVGEALILLGALMFGATIFLVAQIYNINANSHALMLLWIFGILPLVYAFESKPIAVLSIILSYIWLGLFVFRGLEIWQAEQDIIKLPALYLVFGILFFGIGAMHYFYEKYADIGRMHRLFGLQIFMLSLFLLTFEVFSEAPESYGYHRPDYYPSGQFTLWFVVFAVLGLLLSAANLFYNPSKSKTNVFENSISLGMLMFMFFFFFFPSTSPIYLFLFNLIMTGLIATLIYVGYSKADMTVVNLGFFWAAIFIMAKYFDFFWDMIDVSLFFLIGGFILVMGGIALEKKRRQLRIQFANKSEL